MIPGVHVESSTINIQNTKGIHYYVNRQSNIGFK